MPTVLQQCVAEHRYGLFLIICTVGSPFQSVLASTLSSQGNLHQQDLSCSLVKHELAVDVKSVSFCSLGVLISSAPANNILYDTERLPVLSELN